MRLLNCNFCFYFLNKAKRSSACFGNFILVRFFNAFLYTAKFLKMKNLVLGLLLIATCCKSASAQHDHSQTRISETDQKKPPPPSNLFHGIYKHYIGIKDALVAGNMQVAATHANKLAQDASAISYRDLSEGNVNALRKDASLKADAKDIETQRRTFSNLSNNMSALADHFKLSDKAVYLQYCPMAKAYWLSNEEVIRNPYYGSSMLSCGSVTKTF